MLCASSFLINNRQKSACTHRKEQGKRLEKDVSKSEKRLIEFFRIC